MENNYINIGKIINYDGYVGSIITPYGNFMFLDEDVIGEVKNGDYVMFRPESVEKDKKAFFIRKIELHQMGNARVKDIRDSNQKN